MRWRKATPCCAPVLPSCRRWYPAPSTPPCAPSGEPGEQLLRQVLRGIPPEQALRSAQGMLQHYLAPPPPAAGETPYLIALSALLLFAAAAIVRRALSQGRIARAWRARSAYAYLGLAAIRLLTLAALPIVVGRPCRCSPCCPMAAGASWARQLCRHPALPNQPLPGAAGLLLHAARHAAVDTAQYQPARRDWPRAGPRPVAALSAPASGLSRAADHSWAVPNYITALIRRACSTVVRGDKRPLSWLGLSPVAWFSTSRPGWPPMSRPTSGWASRS